MTSRDVDTLTLDELHDVLHQGPGVDFAPIELDGVVRRGRRRRLVRRSAAGLAALAVVASLGLSATLIDRSSANFAPSTDRTTAPVDGHHTSSYQTFDRQYRDCLRENHLTVPEFDPGAASTVEEWRAAFDRRAAAEEQASNAGCVLHPPQVNDGSSRRWPAQPEDGVLATANVLGLQTYLGCLQDHGQRVTGVNKIGWFAFLDGSGTIVSASSLEGDATYVAATQACRDLFVSATRASERAFGQWADVPPPPAAYWANYRGCLRDHGLTVTPQPGGGAGAEAIAAVARANKEVARAAAGAGCVWAPPYQ